VTALRDLAIPLAGDDPALPDDDLAPVLERLDGARVVGLTSGASAPERLVDRLLAWLAAQGATEVEELRLTEEHLRFSDVRV
jgi:4-hydroxy-3-methylbut-2-enyl diphosphate reductase